MLAKYLYAFEIKIKNISFTVMIDTGIGGTKLNTYLSALNIHTFDDKSLKRNERSAGKKLNL